MAVASNKGRVIVSMYNHSLEMMEELMELDGLNKSNFIEQLIIEEYHRRELNKNKSNGEDTDN